MTNYTEQYRTMSDGELDRIAQDVDDLTDAAREALKAEFTRRGVELPQVARAEWDAEEPLVVAQFLNLHKALLAKGQLESAGIACSLRDDNMVRMDWFISNLLGGVKLAVSPADVDHAKELLSQPIPENFDVEGVGEYEQPRCPECDSVEITYESLNKPVAYGSAWLGVPIPLKANRWRCEACRHTWEMTQNPHETE